MKFYLPLLLALCIALPTLVLAQAPSQFNYQGVARDNDGNVLENQSIGLQIDLHKTTATGTIVFTETHATSTNSFGLFNIAIGNGSAQVGTLSGIDWSAGPYFSEISLDITGGTNYQSMGTSQLLAVPYALYAETSGDAGSSIFANTLGVTSNENGAYATDNFVFGSPQLDDDGDVDHDNRLFFDKTKGAFRAGRASGADWDSGNLGDHSTSFGFNNKASGYSSTAMGSSSEATGSSSTAMGFNTLASGDQSTAMGYQTLASGSYSTALGYYSEATGNGSIAMGAFVTAPSPWEIAIGRFNTEYTPADLVLWDASDRLFVIGNGTGSGGNPTSDAMVVLKNGNTGIDVSNPLTKLHVSSGNWDLNSTNGDFMIGDGTHNLKFAVSDAGAGAGTARINMMGGLATLKLGGAGNDVVHITDSDVGIGTASPTAKLSVNGTANKPGGGSWTAFSDRRLKQNITPYTDGLEQLLSINPVKYQYNELAKTDTKKEHIGVIAQELKEVAPYMVGSFKMEGKEYYDVDNSAMMYMLINSVKEQNELIQQLRKEVELLKKHQR
ncbi:MAG: tail fiber domain-containing protein [Flavobacteriales bacterium]